jgi:hypothetical protein
MRAAALGGHDSAAVAQVGALALPRAPGLLYKRGAACPISTR